MDSLSQKHIESSSLQITIILMAALATTVFGFLAIGIGSSEKLGFFNTAKIILGYCGGTPTDFDIIWRLRFPRILMGVVAGVSLAVAGALMQGCLGNPLVSPLTLGVASGASLGASLAIIAGVSIVAVPELAIVANSFLFSLIVVAIIIQLGKYRSVSAESYILVGIAITFICGAIVSTLTYFASDAELSQLTHWSFGSLSRTNLVTTVLIAIAIVILLPTAMVWAWDLNALSVLSLIHISETTRRVEISLSVLCL